MLFLCLGKDLRSSDPIMLVREFHTVRGLKKCSVDLEITIAGSKTSRSYRGESVALNKNAKEALDEGNAMSVSQAFNTDRAQITLCIENN